MFLLGILLICIKKTTNTRQTLNYLTFKSFIEQPFKTSSKKVNKQIIKETQQFH